MTDVAPPSPTFPIVIDAKVVEARRGEMLIAAAERGGVYIPRFCYHPRMRPVGMCRMCLVDVKGPRGFSLQPACFIPVAEDQEVVTTSPAVKKAQDGVLEFLLINHPLDCPVCDKGGECPLQDQTLAFGPGETRFVEEKRHWAKPLALSDLVLLDRERCIQCDRCTRFAGEVAGDPLIEFVGRGDTTEINTFPDEPFSSYFSGNTVQICPVGALTAVPYRFRARPWDLEQVESTCTTCSVGCRVAVQSSADRLTRYIGVDSDPVNHGWLCDKGRFAYEAINNDNRLVAPLLRRRDQLVEASWGEALDAAAEALSDARTTFGPASIGVIGGARLANEDAYVWAKLAKSVLGTDNTDAQLGDGLPADLVLGLPRATIDDACSADAVVLLAPDLKEELPVLYLRLRAAAVDDHVPLIEITPQPTGLSRYAKASIAYRPGEAALAARELLDGDLLAGAARIVVVLGRPSVAESAASIADAASVLAAREGVTFLPALRRANVLGALDMGLAPNVLPGRVSLEAGRSWWLDVWGNAPDTGGLDTAGMLTAAAAGQLQALILLGADPLSDFPDADLAQRALDRVGFTVAVATLLDRSAETADVVLPVAAFAERAGTTTNIEGRITRLGQKITQPGVAWPDWMVAVELARRLGGDLGFDEFADVWAEIEHNSSVHAGVTPGLLASRPHRDGVVVPIAEDAGAVAPVDATTDPAATPGIVVSEVDSPGGPERLAESGEEETVVEADATGEAVLERPPLITWVPSGSTTAAPAPDAYSLRLVSGRKLYDAGVAVTASPSLAGLVAPVALKMNPSDLDRLGVKSGGQVRLRAARVDTVVPVVAEPALPKGSAALPFNVGQLDVGQLIDITRAVNDVVVESTT